LRPQFRPLVRVEGAFEQRAEDRRLDGGPIGARSVDQQL
jgi:hypothetical protein